MAAGVRNEKGERKTVGGGGWNDQNAQYRPCHSFLLNSNCVKSGIYYAKYYGWGRGMAAGEKSEKGERKTEDS